MFTGANAGKRHDETVSKPFLDAKVDISIVYALMDLSSLFPEFNSRSLISQYNGRFDFIYVLFNQFAIVPPSQSENWNRKIHCSIGELKNGISPISWSEAAAYFGFQNVWEFVGGFYPVPRNFVSADILRKTPPQAPNLSFPSEDRFCPFQTEKILRWLVQNGINEVVTQDSWLSDSANEKCLSRESIDNFECGLGGEQALATRDESFAMVLCKDMFYSLLCFKGTRYGRLWDECGLEGFLADQDTVADWIRERIPPRNLLF